MEKACGGKLVLQGAKGETQVSSVVIDSRNITEQGVFIATVGNKVDGHQFIAAVFEKGVCCVVTEKSPEQVEKEHGIAVSKWGSYILVKDSFQALKDIAEYYRSTLQIPVIGITGSVGKTSTKEFIATVLSEKYQVLKTIDNYNNEVGVPLTLLQIREEHEAAVIEMGISDFGEMHRLSKMVRPTICVITNIGQNHLITLKSREGIFKAKTEIFDFMKEDADVCLNGEDDKLSTIQEVHGKKPHFFGFGSSSNQEVFASNIVSRGLWGSEAVFHIRQKEEKTEEDSFLVQVTLPGKHMVMNAAAAACTAKILGLTKEQIAEGIRKVMPVAGRSNLIRLSKNVVIDDCYNANSVSMIAAIDLLNKADTPKAAILGDMFDLGEDSDALHQKVGTYAAQSKIEFIFCVGEKSRYMYEAAKKVSSENQTNQTILYFSNTEKVIEALKQNLRTLLPEGTTILVKASNGMEFTKIIEYLKIAFKE